MALLRIDQRYDERQHASVFRMPTPQVFVLQIVDASMILVIRYRRRKDDILVKIHTGKYWNKLTDCGTLRMPHAEWKVMKNAFQASKKYSEYDFAPMGKPIGRGFIA